MPVDPRRLDRRGTARRGWSAAACTAASHLRSEAGSLRPGPGRAKPARSLIRAGSCARTGRDESRDRRRGRLRARRRPPPAPRARDHGVRGRRRTPAGTRTPSGWTPRTPPITWTPGFIVFNDRNYPRFTRLLAQLGVADAAVDHELRRLRRAGLRVQRRVARTACSRTARTWSSRGFTAWSPTWCASIATRWRCCAPAARGRRSAHWLEERRYSRAFVERLIVPQASAVWSADPRADVDVPGALPGRVLRQPRRCSASATGRSGGRSAAARGRTSRR